MSASFPWNGSELVHREYTKDNYRVIHTEAKTKRAIIFFSGNGIYFPNTEEEFTRKIIINDRYEWENIARDDLMTQYYELIIFVRDIYKQWYVNGINVKYDSVDKTADLLRKITAGFHVTTCGNSAGGYAAVVFAHLLDAERFFTISGQFSIGNKKNNGPLIKANISVDAKSRYYNATAFTHRGGGHYFWPAKCEEDKNQNELVKSSPIKSIPFNKKHHGQTMPPYLFPFILSRNEEQLTKIIDSVKNKTPVNPVKFAFDLLPLKIFLPCLVKSSVNDLKRKFLRLIFRKPTAKKRPAK